MGILSFESVEEVHAMTGKYDAVSHVWGNARPLYHAANTINNGKTLLNSEEKLATVKNILQISDQEGIPIWMDVYSVQQDDIAVKSHQVSLMYEIYRNCRECIVLMSDEDCEIIKKCDEVEKILAKFYDDNDFSEDIVNNCDSAITNIFPNYYLRQIEYFSRLWTLQESVLPKNLILHHGEIRVDLDELARRFLSTLNKVVDLEDSLPSQFFYSIIGIKNSDVLTGLETCILSHDKIQEMSLQDRVTMFWYRQARFCTVAHDLVYSVFTLMGWELVPDYTKDYTQLIADINAPLIEAGIVEVAPLSIKYFREGRVDAIPDPKSETSEKYSWLGIHSGTPEVPSTWAIATRWYNGIVPNGFREAMEGSIKFENGVMNAKVSTFGRIYFEEKDRFMGLGNLLEASPPESARWPSEDKLLVSQHVAGGISIIIGIHGETYELVGGYLCCNEEVISLSVGSCEYVVNGDEVVAFVGHSLCLVNKECNKIHASFAQGAIFVDDDWRMNFGPFLDNEAYKTLAECVKRMEVG
ncbi:hypothetical protein HK096_007275, partial [Nowakowskiella sp. JEL0078]